MLSVLVHIRYYALKQITRYKSVVLGTTHIMVFWQRYSDEGFYVARVF